MRKFPTLARLLSAAALLTLPLAGMAQGNVVFSQVYSGGGSTNASASYKQDFVELYNRSASPVNIGGWSVQYGSATANSSFGAVSAIPANTILPAGSYYSIALGTASTGGATLPATDLVGASGTNLAAAGGKVALVNNSTAIGASFTSTNIVDVVAYGTATQAEGGSAVGALSISTAAIRNGTPQGSTDTNNNAADFTVATPIAPHYTAQEINVKQGATSIASGGSFSGFPSSSVGVAAAPVTFTIQNLGNASLGVTSIVSSNSEFAVGAMTPTANAVAGNNSGTFNVTFTPSGTGTRTATLTITNTDSDEGTYTISLSGTGVTATANPEINVQQAGTDYLTTSTYSGFANTVQGSSASPVTFTIQSLNGDPLTVSNIATSGTNAGDFAVSALSPVSPVAGNSSATFTVTFTPSGTGTRIAALTITSNDADEASYVINLSGMGLAQAPTLTSASPTSLLVGISSPVVLTGTNLTASTVNFNGGTLTPSSNSSTTLTVRITPPGTGPYPVTVTTSGGTSNSVSISATTPPTGFFEPFEADTRNGYTGATALAFSTGPWILTNALTGNPANSDVSNNAQSLRIQTSTATTVSGAYMNFDKPNGAGTITLKAARYSGDAAGPLNVAVSNDGGATWTAYTSSQTITNSGSFGTYTFTANVAGPIRIRISNATVTTSAGAPRLDVDDVQISDYTAAAVGDITVTTTGVTLNGTYNNVTIANGGSATVSGNLTVNNSFTVESGGTLFTNCQSITGAGTFTVMADATLGVCDANGITASGATGAVQMTGARSFSSDASYIYNGTVAQVTGSGLPTQVRNLTLNNTASPVANRTVTLTNPLSVSQVVRLTSGSLNLGTGASAKAFTLLSTPGGGTALIYNEGSTTSAVVTGAGTMQRAIDTTNPENIGYHHFSSPVSSTTINDLATPGFDLVLNPAYNTATLAGQVRPFPTVFGYDERRLTPANGLTGTAASSPATDLNNFDKGFYSPASGDPMVVGRGYTANFPNALTTDFTGTFNNGNITISGLTRGTDPDAGWQFLGNPYPSPINASTITGLTNMDANVYVWHATSRYSGYYTTYNITSNTGTTAPTPGPTSSVINAGSGFWMRVTTPSTTNGAVALTNTNRVTTFGSQPAFGRQTSTRAELQLQLNGAGTSDVAYLYFDAAATAGVDAQYDAVKLPNTTGLNLATVSSTRQLAIDGRPAPTTATVLPLFVGVPAAGSYTLNPARFTGFGTMSVYLRDALTGTRTLLNGSNSYRFTMTTTSAAGRFSLEFAPAGSALATAGQALAAQVQLYPNPTQGRFHVVLPAGAKAMSATLTNALGQTVLTRTLAGNEADFSVATPGVYTLRLMVDGNAVTRKVVVQ